MPIPTVATNQANTKAEITLPNGQKLEMNATELDAFIQALGHARGSIAPFPPSELPVGTMVAINDPAWVAAHQPGAGGSFLHLRDPRFGWLSYVLPRKEAAYMGALFIHMAAAQAPPLEPEMKN